VCVLGGGNWCMRVESSWAEWRRARGEVCVAVGGGCVAVEVAVEVGGGVGFLATAATLSRPPSALRPPPSALRPPPPSALGGRYEVEGRRGQRGV
jgi:hypothetical protein